MKNFIAVIGFISSFFIVSCSNQQKLNTTNTYYVEMVNCKDTLKNYLTQNLSGKVSYFKNNKLQVLSLNYITEDYPDMHYYKTIGELDKEIKEGTKKIKIEFAGNYTIDSSSYSVTNYFYKNNSWIKTSDVGFTKASPQNINMYDKSRDFFMWDLGGQIVKAVALSTY